MHIASKGWANRWARATTSQRMEELFIPMSFLYSVFKIFSIQGRCLGYLVIETCKIRPTMNIVKILPTIRNPPDIAIEIRKVANETFWVEQIYRMGQMLFRPWTHPIVFSKTVSTRAVAHFWWACRCCMQSNCRGQSVETTLRRRRITRIVWRAPLLLALLNNLNSGTGSIGLSLQDSFQSRSAQRYSNPPSKKSYCSFRKEPRQDISHSFPNWGLNLFSSTSCSILPDSKVFKNRKGQEEERQREL